MVQEERLREGVLVQAVFAQGARFSDRRLVLFVLRRESGRRRCAFAVGKKLGGAVVRNRTRRRMREAYRRERKELLQGCDLVLVARPGAVTSPFPELCASVRDLFRRGEDWRLRCGPPKASSGASDSTKV